MESSVSVSKGCFVYKNGVVGSRGGSRKRRQSGAILPTFLPQSILRSEWYHGFREFWEKINGNIEDILTQNHSSVMENVLECIQKSNSTIYNALFPAIVLQTGINQPDHLTMFDRLATRIAQQEDSYSVVLTSNDATNIKGAIESLVGSFIRQFFRDECEIRKHNCTMRSLCGAFSAQQNTNSVLVVVIPDFEAFCKVTLRELVTILASYRHTLPLVVVFGVATSISALEQVLPLKFTSMAKFHVFQTQSFVSVLNDIVEKVILQEKILPSGRVLQFLVEKFLFYDFSVSGFIQGLKFCLLEHFYHHEKLAILPLGAPSGILQCHEDCESIRRLMSVRRYIEALNDSQEIISLLTNDKHLSERVEKSWFPAIEEFFLLFHAALHFLHELVCDLPKAPLGKKLRELYCITSVHAITSSPEYAECKQILGVMSRESFVGKVENAAVKVGDFLKMKFCPKVEKKIGTALNRILKVAQRPPGKNVEEKSNIGNVTNRFELQKMLLENAKHQTSQTRGITECLKVLEDEILAPWLLPFSRGPPLIELFVHMDASATRRHLMGSPRGALHQALTNPQHYLQCECCTGSSLNWHFPDLTIAYRLHSECGRMINLFDWLQAFQAIVHQKDDVDENGCIIPQVQARFTRAVCELEFLGFIKSSKRKVDHVEKLTW